VRIASLGSGSRGNATIVEAGGRRLLVDCGLSLREMQRRSATQDIDLASLEAILVTHEHTDHCSGVGALARHYKLPVYLTHGTLASGRIEGCPQTEVFNADSEFLIGGMQVRAVAVPHDAREPVQYCFSHGGQTLGVLTDLGSITPHVIAAYEACDLLLLEFNHDRQLLAEGPYPPALKQRVGGAWGHLSNEQAVELLQRVDRDRLQALIVAHVSEKNNQREAVEAALARVPDLLPITHWATQSDGFAWISTVENGPASTEADSLSPSLVSASTVGAY